MEVWENGEWSAALLLYLYRGLALNAAFVDCFPSGGLTIFHLSNLLFFFSTMPDCFHQRGRKAAGSTDRRILYYIFLPNSDLCFPSLELTKDS